jgi:hypothetical protein
MALDFTWGELDLLSNKLCEQTDRLVEPKESKDLSLGLSLCSV